MRYVCLPTFILPVTMLKRPRASKAWITRGQIGLCRSAARTLRARSKAGNFTPLASLGPSVRRFLTFRSAATLPNRLRWP